MAAQQSRSVAEQLRDAADQLYRLADLAETSRRSDPRNELVRDEIEVVAGDIRAIVRGPVRR